MSKREIFNNGKADLVIHQQAYKNAEKIVVGSEECILLKWTQAEIDNHMKKGRQLWGHMSKKGFILCNLHLIK